MCFVIDWERYDRAKNLLSVANKCREDLAWACEESGGAPCGC